MILNSRLYVGKVYHERRTPLIHRFTYPAYGYVLDIDELDELGRKLLFFAHNKFSPVSIYDKDYLGSAGGTIREKLVRFLSQVCAAEELGKVELVTSARFFNYVFNPVNFYYCYKTSGELLAVVTEINNTFGEKHLYVLSEDSRVGSKFLASYTFKKDFHVSPFYNMEGDYKFHFSNLAEKFDIQTEIFRDGRKDFHARLWGKQIPLTSKNLMKTLLRFPITASLTMPRILWQAAQLHYYKKLPVYTKPNPRSEMTIGILAPTLRERFAKRVLYSYFAKLKCGKLNFIDPHGDVASFGDKESKFEATVRIKNYSFYWKVIKGGDIGFGESYAEGDWDSDNLSRVLAIFINNFEHFDDREIATSIFRKTFDQVRHNLRKNSIKGSKDNIGAHYDLSNELFETFLDETMMYSSALFKNEGDSLYAAQINKLHSIIEQAEIGESDHVLEIGSGWGGFAIEAVKQTGCRVTTVTISEEQFDYAKKRIRDAGLQDKIEIQLCDYRKIQGSYDKIVSIEMIEAVGEKYLGTFFNCCDKLLKSDGLLFLQLISMPDERIDAYRNSGDWIQKHIFPGCFVPSLSVLKSAMGSSSSFQIKAMRDIGLHYAKTLGIWKDNFNKKSSSLDALGFDARFQRAWNYYFSYCEAGFSTKYLADLHLVLKKVSA